MGEIVAISGPPYEQFAQMSLDVMSHRYDIVIDEAPATANGPLEIWKTLTDQGMLMQLLQANLFPVTEIPNIVPDIPQQTRDAWSQHLQMMMQAPAQPGPEEGELP